jgi:hypothetical protein
MQWKTNNGMISFCKATKVDLDASYNSGNDGGDISPNDAIVSSTLLLTSVLFESFTNLDTAINEGFSVPIQDIPLKDARTMIMVPKKNAEKKRKQDFFYSSHNIIHQKTYHHATLISYEFTRHGVTFVRMNIQKTQYASWSKSAKEYMARM